jgi:hypothetical protein
MIKPPARRDTIIMLGDIQIHLVFERTFCLLNYSITVTMHNYAVNSHGFTALLVH